MFIKTIRKSSITTFVLLLSCVFCGWILLKWPEAASSGINRGISISTSILIPSLFPFLVLSSFIVKTGLSETVGRKLERPMRFFFGLPGSCATGILVGFIGGYPAGSIVVNELLDKGEITKTEARHMICFCVNGGPAFIISAVGATMMGGIKYGVILYVAHVLAAIIIGMLFRTNKKGEKSKKAPAFSKIKKQSPSIAFVDAVYDSCRSMVMMCGFLILFTALLAIIDGAGITYHLMSFVDKTFKSYGKNNIFTAVISTAIPSLLEVSCGSMEAATHGMFAPFLLGMTLGWGGLSVHFQVAAALRGKNLIGKRFVVARVIHSLLGGLISVLLFRFVPIPLETINQQINIQPHSTTVFGTTALLAMCAIFIISLVGRNKEEDFSIGANGGA